MKVRMIAVLILSCALVTFPLQARATQAPTNPDAKVRVQRQAGFQGTQTGASSCPGPVAEKTFLKNLWCDQKAIWSSPFRTSSYRPSFLIPFAGSTAMLLATDQEVVRRIADNPPGMAYDFGKGISYMGSAAGVLGFSGALYGIARVRHDDGLRKTALLSLEALVDSGIVQGIIKAATQRERPARDDGRELIDDGRGRFWAGGTSFPSGHSMSSWTLAGVFATRYPDKPAIKYGAYGLAAAISISRLPARRHFPSDVLVGSVLGYLIGRHVAHKHPN